MQLKENWMIGRFITPRLSSAIFWLISLDVNIFMDLKCSLAFLTNNRHYFSIVYYMVTFFNDEISSLRSMMTTKIIQMFEDNVLFQNLATHC